MSDDWRTRAKPASYPAARQAYAESMGELAAAVVHKKSGRRPSKATVRKVVAKVLADPEFAVITGRVSLKLGMELKSFANVKEHPFAKSDRVKRQRELGALMVRPAMRKAGPLVAVVLRRIAPGTLDDDNLRSAFKALRDGIADGLMLRDDKSPLVRWVYQQRKDGPGVYDVEIDVLPVSEVPAE